MHNTPVPLDLNSLHQPPHLSRTQTRHFGRLLLTDLFLQGLTNQVESRFVWWFYTQDVRSLHLAKPVIIILGRHGM
jgi:hypothetical protein